MSCLLVALLLLATVATSCAGLLPFDTRWEYPHYVTFRPGNGQVSDVNPPRLSWPYVPHVVIGPDPVPLQEFCLQFSRTGDFTKPDLEFRTAFNFYNALPVLDDTRWYWRVGYLVGTKREQWSAVRSFTFASNAVKWDRTVINDAARMLATKPHPRLAPKGADWKAWRGILTSSDQRQWLDALMEEAGKAVREPWWNDFPKSDRKGKNPYTDQGWTEIGRKIAVATFAYKLSGSNGFAKAKDLALAMASIPRGGQASPEFHGPTTKVPTQITEYLALCYDWWHEDLTASERKTMLDCLDWRLRATYLERNSWRNGGSIVPAGIAVLTGSHPYENAMWCLPAVLLLAGDLPVADELVGLCLNYLTGVTSSFGADGTWNEGPSYSHHKANGMVRASVYTALLLPELHVEKNPFYRGLADWLKHMMPLGAECIPFGDYGRTTEHIWPAARNNSRFLSWLIGDGWSTCYWRSLSAIVGESPTNRPWLELLGSCVFDTPSPRSDEPACALFPEAGWVMVSNRPPTEQKDAVGMVFLCRPRGGYSHSYRNENSFTWYAYGQTLNGGGGTTVYPDPHSRHSMSHNVVMVNGVGQEWNHSSPAYPFVGRLIAYEKGNGYVHWVGDATHAYQSCPDLRRWHRHVVYVDEKWFVIFDDVALVPDADPSRFSWLYHVWPKVPVRIDADSGAFSYKVGDVNAHVSLAGDPKGLEIVDMQGREGFKNPITGEDMYVVTKEKIAPKIPEFTEDHWMAHNLWITNRNPSLEWTFLATLAAWREGDTAPRVVYHGDRYVTIVESAATKRSISFDPARKADIVIDVDAVRRHAESTDPGTRPVKGSAETVSIDGDTYRVEWLARESFADDSWTSRWIPEGDCEVKVQEGRLYVRGIRPGKSNAETVWYRPELPDSLIVRFKAKVLPPEAENAANLNVFLHAREPDGKDVKFGRSGVYAEYHKIPNYIVTLTGGVQPGWSRVRRDPGFNMLHEAEVRSEVGKEYDIAVTVQKGHIRYYLNGRKWHDVQDSDPLPGGKFALRTWSTNAWWKDVEFGRIVAEKE